MMPAPAPNADNQGLMTLAHRVLQKSHVAGFEGADLSVARGDFKRALDLYQRSLILTCFTGEKFTIGQERFAPHILIWGCSAPQADRPSHDQGPPMVDLFRPVVAVGERPAIGLGAMKQVNI